MLTDTIADYATQIRNASMVGKQSVTLKSTKAIKSIADVMVAEHYLESATVADGKLTLVLNYVSGKPAINSIKRISKPGIRIYKKSHELNKVLSGLGIGIISTSHGVMSNAQAIKNKLGGEVLLELW
jgi:small subunit ribosomal protein S8